MKYTSAFRRTVALCLIMPLASPASAFDISPGDYVWLGDGKNLFLTYGQIARSDTLNLDGTGSVPDSSLSTAAGILRGVTYHELGGHRFSFQAILPYVSIGKADVAGAPQSVADGLGDLTMAATYYPLASAEPTGTTLGLTLFVTAPTGAYETGQLSVGSGAWILTPQIGIVQGLGEGWFLDGALDVAFQVDSEHDGVKRERDPTTQIQAYVRKQVSPATAISFGYSGSFGGELEVDGTYTGMNARKDQVRLFGSTFLSPTDQVQIMLSKDLRAEGGFEDDGTVQFRYLKLF